MRAVPFATIAAAKQSDMEAIDFIRSHFERYITSRCLNSYSDQHGNMKSFVDDELLYHAENAMLSAIFTFQFRDPPADYIA